MHAKSVFGWFYHLLEFKRDIFVRLETYAQIN